MQMDLHTNLEDDLMHSNIPHDIGKVLPHFHALLIVRLAKFYSKAIKGRFAVIFVW